MPIRLVAVSMLASFLVACGGAGRVPERGAPVEEGEAVMWMGGEEGGQIETVETGEPPPPLPPCPEVPDGGPPPDAGGPCMPRGGR